MKSKLLIITCFFLAGCNLTVDPLSCLPYSISERSASKTETTPPVNSAPGYFSSCKEIETYVNANSHHYNQIMAQYSNQESSQCAPLQAAPVMAEQPTNTQENVDESDSVKVSNNYIFYARPGLIRVVDKSNLQYIKTIKLNDHDVPKIFVGNETLIVIQNEQDNRIQGRSQAMILPSGPGQINVSYFDVNDDFKQIESKSIQGTYLDSRFSDEGHLTLIANIPLTRYPSGEDHIYQSLSDVDCAKIQKPFVNDHDLSLTQIHHLNLSQEDQKLVHSKTVLFGTYSNIYMNRRLFLSKTVNSWSTANDIPWTDQGLTNVVGLNETQEGWQFDGMGSVKGQAISSWSFKEKDDYLFVATTHAERASALTVLKKEGLEYKEVSAITGLAFGEILRSVRFYKNYAYLVTYRDIDPLFVIDIEDPEHPSLKGELKIPGFSTYLHPVSEGRLLGVGYDDSLGKVQVSLFDVSHPEHPTALEQILIGDDYTTSLAQWDHHAFYYDPSRNRMALPISTRKESGSQLYRLDQDRLQLEAKVDHDAWLKLFCPRQSVAAYNLDYYRGIERLLNIDGRLLSFSSFGIKEHDQETPSTILNSLTFPTPVESCPPPYHYPGGWTGWTQ